MPLISKISVFLRVGVFALRKLLQVDNGALQNGTKSGPVVGSGISPAGNGAFVACPEIVGSAWETNGSGLVVESDAFSVAIWLELNQSNVVVRRARP